VETALPWGVDFGNGVARHPVQLYESGAMAGFFFYALWRLRVDRAGFEQTIFYQFILWYTLQRFAWELLKPYEPVALGINLFGWVCIGLFVYALVFLNRVRWG
jgi:prolipoprotein diacylglyceryltransferase